MKLYVLAFALTLGVVAGLRCDACGGREVCRWDETCCDGRCVKMRNDPYNCGKCGRTCAAGEKCVDGCCGCESDNPAPPPPPPAPSSQWLQCSCKKGDTFKIRVCGVCPLKQEQLDSRCELACGKKGVKTAICTNEKLSNTAVATCNEVTPGNNQVSCQAKDGKGNPWYEICTSKTFSSLDLSKLCKSVIDTPAAKILYQENSKLCGGNPSEEGSELACTGCGDADEAYFCAAKPKGRHKADAKAECQSRCGKKAEAVHWKGPCCRV